MTIALDPDWISDISMDTYSVSIVDTSSNIISPDRFSRYLSIISDPNYGRLAQDHLLNSDGSLKTGAEPLAALLICDLIQSGPITDLGIKSEDFGGAYAYTKSEAAASSVKSGFLAKYELLLEKYNEGDVVTVGVNRSDKLIEFAKLSQGKPPYIVDSSDDYPGLI